MRRWPRYAGAGLLFALGGVACGSDPKSSVVRAGACASERFVNMSLADTSISPTGQGYFQMCDKEQAAKLLSPLPIEVYSEPRRGAVIAWLYSTTCGFPEGLVSGGSPHPKDCNVTVTVATAPPG